MPSHSRRIKAGHGLRVGVVGATGMVGRELAAILEDRRFPVGEFLPFSSGRSRYRISFRGRGYPVPGVTPGGLELCDLVFLVSSEEVARRHGPALAARGVWVIDDSSEFRLDPEVPLVIPEVNSEALSPSRRLVAGPNCTLTGIAVAGWPLHRAACVRELRLASYQAVSGAGRAALEEFFIQNRRLAKNLRFGGDGRAPVLSIPEHQVLPQPIAGNVFPQVGGFDSAGHSGEENKVRAELRKIWGLPSLRVSVTAVRVPVVRGHSLAAWLGFSRPLSTSRVRGLLRRALGVRLHPVGKYPTPLAAAGLGPVQVGRIRPGVDAREVCLWIVSDNLLKGAALNSVQIAEHILRRGWFGRK